MFTRLSVIIVNYNYARFVAEAIESALALDWREVEVIVVDDGSTDDSLQVIRRYADRIQVLERENRGQRVSANEAYQHATGDATIFLDSDDVLEPGIAAAAAAVMGEAVSKVQVRMARINASGEFLGSEYPTFRPVPSPEQVRHWMLTTGHHPTPPGSGNVYSRSFLDRVFPLSDACGEATDSSLLVAAPILGDVITVDKPLVRYRIHGNNISNPLRAENWFIRYVDRAVRRHRFALQLRGLPENRETMAPLFRGRPLLQLRVAGRRTRPQDHPLPGDSAPRILADITRSVFTPGPETIFKRITIMTWCLLTMAAPGPAARWLIRRRFRPRT